MEEECVQVGENTAGGVAHYEPLERQHGESGLRGRVSSLLACFTIRTRIGRTVLAVSDRKSVV